MFRDGEWQNDPSGDLGRINRQQYFIRVALKRAIAKGVRNPATLRRLVDIGVQSVGIDEQLRPADVMDLGQRFRNFSPENLQDLHRARGRRGPRRRAGARAAGRRGRADPRRSSAASRSSETDDGHCGAQPDAGAGAGGERLADRRPGPSDDRRAHPHRVHPGDARQRRHDAEHDAPLRARAGRAGSPRGPVPGRPGAVRGVRPGGRHGRRASSPARTSRARSTEPKADDQVPQVSTSTTSTTTTVPDTTTTTTTLVGSCPGSRRRRPPAEDLGAVAELRLHDLEHPGPEGGGVEGGRVGSDRVGVPLVGHAFLDRLRDPVGRRLVEEQAGDARLDGVEEPAPAQRDRRPPERSGLEGREAEVLVGGGDERLAVGVQPAERASVRLLNSSTFDGRTCSSAFRPGPSPTTTRRSSGRCSNAATTASTFLYGRSRDTQRWNPGSSPGVGLLGGMSGPCRGAAGAPRLRCRRCAAAGSAISVELQRCTSALAVAARSQRSQERRNQPDRPGSHPGRAGVGVGLVEPAGRGVPVDDLPAARLDPVRPAGRRADHDRRSSTPEQAEPEGVDREGGPVGPPHPREAVEAGRLDHHPRRTRDRCGPGRRTTW